MRDKARVEDAYTSASASLNTLRRRTELLREENKAFMATYDNHLEKLVCVCVCWGWVDSLGRGPSVLCVEQRKDVAQLQQLCTTNIWVHQTYRCLLPRQA